MKLPNVDKAVIEREKIVNYLLNAEHPYGASKARFFANFGFQAEEWKQLAQALRRHGQMHEVNRCEKPDLALVSKWKENWRQPMDACHECARSGNRIKEQLRHA